MSKKRLPKAIRRTGDDTPATGAGGADAHDAPVRPADASERHGRGVAAPASAAADDVIEMAPSSEPASARPADAAPAPMHEHPDVARRRTQALAIVERHTAFSLAGGIIPLPLVNVAGIMAIIVRMVKKLSDHYDVPFERDRTRAIVVGLVGGAMPTGLGAATASTLFYLVPGSTLIGLAVSSIAAAACTHGVGRIFVEHFESGATLVDFPAIEGR